MPLAGVTPPATLPVVPGSKNHSEVRSLASIDWKSVNFLDEKGLPSQEVLRVATLAAESMAALSPTSAAVNSSFHVQFVGPTVKCSLANGSQQIAFDNFTRILANENNMIATKDLFESGSLKWGSNGIPAMVPPLMNFYSAFSPRAGQHGWMSYSNLSVDAYNNWFPSDGFYTSFYENFHSGEMRIVHPHSLQQTLIQTADQAIVCTLGNASFDVGYEFVETDPPLIQYSISNFEPLWTLLEMSFEASLNIDNEPSYMAVYLAFSSLLNGNVSTTLTNSYTYASQVSQDNESSFDIANCTFDGNVTIYDSSSKVLQHGLSACDDFKQGYVSHLP